MRDRAATRALVLGLLALPFGVLAPLAIWTGARSLKRINDSGGKLTGRAIALTGLVAGVACATFLVIGIVYWWLAS